MAEAQRRTSARNGARSAKSATARRRAKPAMEPDEGVTLPSDSGQHDATPLCSVGFCPICMAVTALGEVKPEFVEHLLLASREVLLALRTLIDARLTAQEQPVKMERLTIE